MSQNADLTGVSIRYEAFTGEWAYIRLFTDPLLIPVDTLARDTGLILNDFKICGNKNVFFIEVLATPVRMPGSNQQ